MNAPYPKQLAFPVPDSKGTPATNGMLLMDYFAARAPTEIPSWFHHIDEFEVPLPISRDQALAMQPAYSNLSEEERDALRHYMKDRADEPNETLMAIGDAAYEAVAKCRQEIKAAIEANEAARYFAWRWHYALTMIRTRTTP
jgi:hypothetical protein